jgi:protein involved in polysaccharide export with SLBB domain
VRGQTETNLDVKIDGDGLIKPVYLNEMRVSGLSIKEIESLLTIEYQNQLIFKNPIVKVYIKKYSERVVYLTGSVNSKGPYTFPPEVEAMNIVEVISRSGGFSLIAKKNKVYVTRTFYDTEGHTKDTKTYEVNVEALSKGSLEHSSSRKFWIYPGDRIEVPERLI